MKTSLIVIDNLYDNIDEVREFALYLPFDVFGNYPEARTKNHFTESAKNIIENALNLNSEKVVDWLDHEGGYSGSFQMTTRHNSSWVHVDAYNDWAGVLYMTPNAPISGGTGFYKSKIDGSLTGDETQGNFPNGTWTDMSKWEKVSEVGNIYNRLILFRSNQWHTSLDYFGEDMNDGRLTQVFFIKTENEEE